MNLRPVLIALVFLLTGLPAKAADLICTKKVEALDDQRKALWERMKASPTDCVIAVLTGPISKDDGLRIVGLLGANPYLFYVDMDSPGGSLPDSLQIGREIRRRNVHTFVPRTGRCASACFFIWIAGVYRGAENNLLVHRFYSDDPRVRAFDSAKLAEFYRAHAELIFRYLQDMEVGGDARRITEMMLHVPPNDAIPFERNSYPHSFGYVPSRDQWLRHRCGNDYWSHETCVVEAFLRERLSQ